MRPLFLLVALPLIEIALFVIVGEWLSLWPTLGLVVLSAVAGMAILRSQGTRTAAELQQAMMQSGDAISPVAHGAMKFMAGFLLLIPGFFTDFLAILLLIPPVRAFLLRKLGGRIQMATAQAQSRSGFNMGGFGPMGGQDPRANGGADDIIDDAEWSEVHQETPPERRVENQRPSGWTKP